MSIVLTLVGVYALSYVVLFCFPTLLHRKKSYAVTRRMLSGRTVKLVPHRGGLLENYENSLKAFELSRKLGAFGVELDLQRTKDDLFVVLHDNNLERITGQRQLASNLNYSEIGSYADRIDPLYTHEVFTKVNADKEKPPLFEDVLKLLKDTDMYINIDIKSNKTEDVVKVCKLITKYGYEDRVIIGFILNSSCKRAVRSAGLDLPVFFNVRETLKVFASVFFGFLPFVPISLDVFSVSGSFETVKQGAMFKTNRRARILLMIVDLLSPVMPLLNWHLKRRGIPAVYWTLNTENDYDKAIKFGANVIMTDYPTKLKRYLAQRNLL